MNLTKTKVKHNQLAIEDLTVNNTSLEPGIIDVHFRLSAGSN